MKHPGGPTFGKSLTQQTRARQQQLVAAYGARLRQAEFAIKQQQFRQAMDWLEPLLASGESRAPALYHVASRGHAQQLLTAGRVEHAARVLAYVVNAWPRDANAWWMLGSARYRQHKYSEAVNAFRRTTSLAPKVAGFHADLAAALEACGDLDASRKSLRKAIKLKPDQRWRKRLTRLDSRRR